MRPGNALWQTSPARLLCLAAIVFTVFVSPSQADEYRLYRIVGSELQLYRRLEFEPDRSPDDGYDSSTPALRDAGFYDVRAEEMADESRRPLSRGDGLLWDALRSRWIGFSSEFTGTLITLDQNDEQRAEELLHEFETVPEAYYQLWPTSDATIYFVTLTSENGEWLPKVTRLQFAENGEIASQETWDMADRDPERMRAAYGKPFPQHETRDSFLPTVSNDGQVYSVVTNITKWDFGVLPPLRVLKHSGESNGYSQCAASPLGEIIAAVSGRDGCYLDLWNATDEEPFQSLPLEEKGWLKGGVVAFTPDGEYLWYNSIFLGHLRIWRCSDWTELDAHRFAGFASFASTHSAEWIILSKDVPFEEEPTDWIERGPYDPELVDGWSEPDFSPEALLRGVVLGLLWKLIMPVDDNESHEESDPERLESDGQ